MNETELRIGDEVLVRLAPDLDPRHFGTGWRIGTVIGIGRDLLADEPVIELDDYGPRLYTAHIEHFSVITPAPLNLALLPYTFDGR